AHARYAPLVEGGTQLLAPRRRLVGLLVARHALANLVRAADEDEHAHDVSDDRGDDGDDGVDSRKNADDGTEVRLDERNRRNEYDPQPLNGSGQRRSEVLQGLKHAKIAPLSRGRVGQFKQNGSE